MADILTYSAGSQGGIKDPVAAATRKAAAIDRLAGQFRDNMFGARVQGVVESQKAAENDIIRRTIDPDRVANDEAYAGAVLRNNLYQTHQGMLAELDNPQSQLSQMTPKQLDEYLASQAQDFYDTNADSEFSATQAKIFANYSLKAQRGIVAKHAKNYKDMVKSNQSQQAVVALASLPAGEGTAFNDNTTMLMEQMLPQDRFTSAERLNLAMSAALGAAHNGDRRLLDYISEFMDGDALVPQQLQVAENAYTAAKRKEEDAGWNQQYIRYDAMAREGVFTQTEYEKLMSNPEAIRRFTRGTINKWRDASHKSHVVAMNMDDAINRFDSGTSLSGYDDKTVQATYQHVFQKMLTDAGQNPDSIVQAMTAFAGKLAKQSIPFKDLKKRMSAYTDRPIFTKEQWNDPKFQEAATMFKCFDSVMTPELMRASLGEEAWRKGALIQDIMKQAGGDPEKAGEIYIQQQNYAKDHPELQTEKLRYDDMAEAMDNILSGSISNRDPNMTSWGFSRTKNAINTRALEYELNKSYGKARAGGLSKEAAFEHAQKEVAAGAKYFGNELVYTGSADVSMQAILGLPLAAGKDQLDEAWEMICDELDIDPSKAHFQVAGQYGYITGEDGLPIADEAMFPVQAIGELYTKRKAEEAQQVEARNDADRVNDIVTRNRMFEVRMNAQLGEVNDEQTILKDGTTIGQYRRADEDTRTAIRLQAEDEQKGVVKYVLGRILAFRDDVRAGKFEGEAADRWRTIQREDPMYGMGDDGYKDSWQKGGADMPQQDEGPVSESAQVAGSRIKQDEGFRGSPYKDSVGVKTVGYGRNLEANPITKAEWKAIGGKRDLNKKPLTEKEAEILYTNDLKRADDAVSRLFKNDLGNLSPRRKEVLINMAFNLGGNKLSKFKKMRAAIRAQDWDKAADEMLDSKWSGQVGRRATRLAAAMRQG